MREGTFVRIIDLHPDDAHYREAEPDKYIGDVGILTSYSVFKTHDEGYCACHMKVEGDRRCFAAVALEVV